MLGLCGSIDSELEALGCFKDLVQPRFRHLRCLKVAESCLFKALLPAAAAPSMMTPRKGSIERLMLRPIECLQCRVKSELVVSLDELRGIEHDVFYLRPLPSVGDVNEAILGLDDSGIAELPFRRVFKDQRGFPGLAVLAHGEV